MRQEEQGGTGETKNSLRFWGSKVHGGGGRRAPMSSRSRGLLPASGPPQSLASPHPLAREVPFKERERKTWRNGQGSRTITQPPIVPPLVPSRPLTGMQAAVTRAAAATRSFPALTSTPTGLHQLSFQHKHWRSSWVTTHSAPPRPQRK